MQKIDVSVIFDFFGVSGQKQLEPEFEDFSREVSERTRTIAFPPPGPPLPPSSHPPSHSCHAHTPFAPFTTPPVCSKEADCARSTSSWAAILDPIMGSKMRRERGWSSFFVAMPPPRAPPRAPLSPRGGLVDGAELWHECVS